MVEKGERVGRRGETMWNLERAVRQRTDSSQFRIDSASVLPTVMRNGAGGVR